MKRGDSVRVLDDVPVFGGKAGVITKAFPKDVWDNPDVPEYTIDIPDFVDSEYNDVVGSNLWFTAEELEAV